MNRIAIALAAIAVFISPAWAEPPQGEINRDRQELRQDRQDLREDRKEMHRDKMERHHDRRKMRRDKMEKMHEACKSGDHAMCEKMHHREERKKRHEGMTRDPHKRMGNAPAAPAAAAAETRN